MALPVMPIATLARNRAAVILASVLAVAAPAAGQDRVLGLLVLPEVFGYGPCQQFEPRAISLHDAPGVAAPIGSIEVDQHWSSAPHGGCEGLKVSVHSGNTCAELPTLEYANDAPGGAETAGQPSLAKGTSVRVLAVRAHGDQSWLQIAVMSHSVCVVAFDHD